MSLIDEIRAAQTEAGEQAVVKHLDSLGLTIAICGSKCDHDSDGPEVAIENGASRSCSKCGKLSIQIDSEQ